MEQYTMYNLWSSLILFYSKTFLKYIPPYIQTYEHICIYIMNKCQIFMELCCLTISQNIFACCFFTYIKDSDSDEKEN